MSRKAWRGLLSASTLTLGLVVGTERGETHKIISSKYTYNRDVFPILRQRCGQCHWADGVAPMSLMTFKDAYPWGESLRAELLTGHMPPWNVMDNIGAFKSRPEITAPEIDTLLTWASGGTPEGDPAHSPPAVSWPREWPLGRPDLLLEPLSAFKLPAEVSDSVGEFTLLTHTIEAKWLRAIDLLPGTPAIVRNATVSIRSQPGDLSSDAGLETERMIAVWVPGEVPVTMVGGTAFQLPAAAELVVRVHYKKTYRYSGKEVADRSSVGLYFADGPALDIRRWTITSPDVTARNGTPLTFSRIVDEDLTVLALIPDPALSNARLEVTAVTSGGSRVPLAHLAIRPDWTRRYWFDQPIALARGSRVEVVVVLNGADGLLPPAASPLPPQRLTGAPIQVMFDVVPG